MEPSIAAWIAHFGYDFATQPLNKKRNKNWRAPRVHQSQTLHRTGIGLPINWGGGCQGGPWGRSPSWQSHVSCMGITWLRPGYLLPGTHSLPWELTDATGCPSVATAGGGGSAGEFGRCSVVRRCRCHEGDAGVTGCPGLRAKWTLGSFGGVRWKTNVRSNDEFRVHGGSS